MLEGVYFHFYNGVLGWKNPLSVNPHTMDFWTLDGLYFKGEDAKWGIAFSISSVLLTICN